MGRTKYTDVDIELFGTAEIVFPDGTRQVTAGTHQTSTVEISSADITGTSVDQISGDDGVEIVPSQGDDQLIEFVSALVTFSDANVAYGAGDDLSIRHEAGDDPLCVDIDAKFLNDPTFVDLQTQVGDAFINVTPVNAAEFNAFAAGVGLRIKSGGSAFTNPGARQQETLTVLENVPGTLTAGNATLTVTAAGMTNSPKTISVALATNDSQNTVATKVRAALNANHDVSSFFTITGATNAVILTAINKAANDTTMAATLADGTCAGLTPATSANTTAGSVDATGTMTVKTVYRVHDLS